MYCVNILVAVTDTVQESDPKPDVVSKASDEESDSKSDGANQAKDNDEKSDEDSDSSDEEDAGALSDETPEENDLSDTDNSEDTTVAKSQGRSLPFFHKACNEALSNSIY